MNLSNVINLKDFPMFIINAIRFPSLILNTNSFFTLLIQILNSLHSLIFKPLNPYFLNLRLLSRIFGPFVVILPILLLI